MTLRTVDKVESWKADRAKGRLIKDIARDWGVSTDTVRRGLKSGVAPSVRKAMEEDERRSA